ncbi:MAG: hypothetical protein PWP16_247 [Eubacteriaceae bacterium]|jgi:uncharacterized protein Veg|nr:hypothetical protein [Eubacteriaceae bacterium]MDK2904600.1 hypothetical protein [Eubacteriaceae bacterium]MDK2935432.1 hypothetical protein [Eubacteriaceae bacterium]MDK2960989.1 hypothetical protein [Eubacteriaceae bacterium]MDN5306884.1 hypothetical protein [Eubacteriaceae bacterium]
MPKATIMDIKREVEHYLGRRVKLEAHKSKKKLYQKEGVIAEAYPSIFTVRIQEDKRKEQKLSFSYSDLLTQSVKIVLLDENGIDQSVLAS